MVTLLNKSLSQHAILKSALLVNAPTRPLPPLHMIFHLIMEPRDGNTREILTMLRKSQFLNVILKSTSQENAKTKDK